MKEYITQERKINLAQELFSSPDIVVGMVIFVVTLIGKLFPVPYSIVALIVFRALLAWFVLLIIRLNRYLLNHV